MMCMENLVNQRLRIAVVIPAYRDNDRLQLCLDALAAQSIGLDSFEIIVANNDPKDPLDGVRFPANARAIVVEKPGSYAARNAAVAITTAPCLAFTDSDCIPGPTWLEAGLADLTSAPDARVTGPIKIFREAGGGLLAYEYEVHTAFRIKEYVGAGRATTANLFVTRPTFERVGPFNEALLSGGDFEWNERATNLAVPISYNEATEIGHPARQSVSAILAKRKRVVRGEASFRHYGTLSRVKYLLKPPVGVIKFDRGNPTRVTRARLFALQYTMNLYALSQWLMAKYGLVKQVRQ
jgi:GT2 family glycosyltransferase